MEICLYHPELGYYTAGANPIGPGGDFLTYPEVHPAFGRLLGRLVQQMWEVMGRPSPFTLLEVGGGKGSLARDLVSYVIQSGSLLSQGLEVALMDRSPVLARRQIEALSSLTHVRILEPNAPFPSLVGCILSNEVADALPVHRVVQRGGRLMEIYVHIKDETIQEVLGPPSDPGILRFLRRLGGELVEGQIMEVPLEGEEWIRKLGRILQRGFVITLDFGYQAQDYFNPARTKGTLMAYRRHRATEDLYALPGGQDLCAHVNFTSLILAGKEAGLELTGLVPQDRLLLNLGLLEEMEALEARREHLPFAQYWSEKLALRRLMLPQPPAGGFQALIQHKGIVDPDLSAIRPLRETLFP